MTRYIIGISTDRVQIRDLFRSYSETDAMFMYIDHREQVTLEYMCFDIVEFINRIRDIHYNKVNGGLPYNSSDVIAKCNDVIKKVIEPFKGSHGVWVSEILGYAKEFMDLLTLVSVVSPSLHFDDIPMTPRGSQLKWVDVCNTAFGTMMIVDGAAYVRVSTDVQSFVIAKNTTLIPERSGIRGFSECGIVTKYSRFENCDIMCRNIGNSKKESIIGLKYNDDKNAPVFTNCKMTEAVIKFLRPSVKVQFDKCELYGASLVAHTASRLLGSVGQFPEISLKECLLGGVIEASSIDVTVDKTIGTLRINQVGDDDADRSPRLNLVNFDKELEVQIGSRLRGIEVICLYDDPTTPLKLDVMTRSTSNITTLELGIQQNWEWEDDDKMNLEVVNVPRITLAHKTDYAIGISTGSTRGINLKTDGDVSDILFRNTPKTTHVVNGDDESPIFVQTLFGRYSTAIAHERGVILSSIKQALVAVTDKAERMTLGLKFGKFMQLFGYRK